MSQAVVLLLQAQAGLLEAPVLLLRKAKKNLGLVRKGAPGYGSRTRSSFLTRYLSKQPSSSSIICSRLSFSSAFFDGT